ncbi:MAG TPA: tetraacyldisaccharide 4'-kinase [Alphaproteobacteria bacterium]|nr:tetraacyldisaccharide 4'-kinase [Alphaproteobacteria bacterium]
MILRAPSFWRADAGRVPRLIAQALAPLGFLVERASLARHGLMAPYRAGVPVICVGNLTVGGAGKTPVVLALAKRLKAAGRRVHLLTRGYGGRLRGPLAVEPSRQGAAEVGDEALLLAQAAPTVVARDRARGAKLALAAGAELIVMDDGFQNPRLYKDLSFIVIDGGTGFGNGLVLPAGPLRESPEEALLRADALVLIGEDRWAALERCRDPELPLLRARLVPKAGQEELRLRPLLAFAGIANPERFFETLESMGCRLADTRAFPDHHRFTDAELAELRARAQARGAELVTTEKDAVRLAPEARHGVHVLKVALEWGEPALLDAVLAPALRASEGA